MKQLIRQFWKKAQHDLVFTQATALAYTSLVSLVPMLAVAFFLFKAFGGFQILETRLQTFIQANLAPSFGEQLSGYVFGFMKNVHAGAVGTFGVIGFMFTAVSTLATIEKTFNLIWGVKRDRPWGQKIMTYWSLVTIGPVLLGFSFVLSSQAVGWLQSDSGEISKVLVWMAALAPNLTSGILFTLLYFFMPNVAVNLKDAAKAGFVTGIVFEIAKLLYASYAARAVSTYSVYGSLAIIPIFLLWLYVVWLIVLFGAELCCFFQYARLKVPFRFDAEERLNPFLISDIIDALAGVQKTQSLGLALSELQKDLKVSIQELTAHIDFLESRGLIVSSAGSARSKNRYFLTVPRAEINMKEVLGWLEEFRYEPKLKTSKDVASQLKKIWDEK
ncbi:MAG: YihY family inner membrane protein [Oligoflexia bacterium]|nr:YihY family inner membrane protein [Oligoflexia bacterium]